MFVVLCAVNHGDYIRAVFDRNIAENISRVLYPVDNVRINAICVLATLSRTLKRRTRVNDRRMSSSSSYICQEHIQHNVQERQIAYGRCDKAEVQH